MIIIQILSKIRSINAIKRYGSKCKYVEIFTHRHVGSIGTPSRRTVFVRGTIAEQRESPEMRADIMASSLNSP
jgi:hypothetical protein